MELWVNNAGVLHTGNAWDHSDEVVQQMIDINVLGMMWGARAAVEAMRAKGGHLINIASLSSIAPVPGLAIYGATKQAVLGFTISLAGDLERAALPIKVSAVCPDGIDTDMVRNVRGSQIRVGEHVRPLRHRRCRSRISDPRLNDDREPSDRGNAQHRDARIAAIEERRDEARHREPAQDARKKKGGGGELVAAEAAHDGERRQRQDETDHEKAGHRTAELCARRVVIERGNWRASDGRGRSHESG